MISLDFGQMTDVGNRDGGGRWTPRRRRRSFVSATATSVYNRYVLANDEHLNIVSRVLSPTPPHTLHISSIYSHVWNCDPQRTPGRGAFWILEADSNRSHAAS